MNYNTWTVDGKPLGPLQYKKSTFHFQGIKYRDYLREYDKLVATGQLQGQKSKSMRLGLSNMLRLR